MGSYNELIISQGEDDIIIQFKVGELWNYKYKIGDFVKVDKGDPAEMVGITTVPGISIEKEGGYKYYSITLNGSKIEDVSSIDVAAYENLIKDLH